MCADHAILFVAVTSLEYSDKAKRAARLQAIRMYASLERGQALLLSDSDPHCESDCEQSYRLLSIVTQFSCSFGYLLITVDHAILWVDARYYLSACQQIGVGEQRERIDEATDAMEVRLYQAENQWLKSLTEVLVGRVAIAIPATTTPNATYLRWQQQLAEHADRITLTLSKLDLRTALKTDAPANGSYPSLYHADAHHGNPDHAATEAVTTTDAVVSSSDAINSTAGVRLIDSLIGRETRSERITMMRELLTHHRLQYFTHNGADDINWMLNIRGDDIAYNQIALCHLLLTPQSFSLYLPADLRAPAVSTTITEALAKDGVRIMPYQQYHEDLRALPDGVDIGVISRRVRCDVVVLLQRKQIAITEIEMPVHRYVKTEAEIVHLRRALVYEGVAMTRLLARIQRNLDTGERMTEATVYRLHLDCRGDEQSFLCESFSAIIGYQEHAAEIHYNRARESDTLLETRGVLLIDCGGHYLHGTTDITRVIACGEVSAEERADYTAVLRGHIALATARFPHGSSGSSLDLCARIPLWRGMRDYHHGTGHGIGWGFNVHDSPYSLSSHTSDKRIEPNMIFSNEPGVYRAGSHGIRLESIIRIVDAAATEGQANAVEQADKSASAGAEESRFLACETLSLCPFDRALIDRTLLTGEEQEWVNAYHRRVATTLTPHLVSEERQWLAEKTAPL